MNALLLLACRGPQHLDVSIADGQVSVADVAIAPVSEIDVYPLDADLPQLAAALAARAREPVTVTASPDDPWYRVRTVFLTTRKAGFSSVTFRAGELTSGPTLESTARGAPGCAASVAASGSRPTLRIDLYGDAKEAWAQLSGRFHPVVGDAIHDLPLACWSGPACDATFPEGPLRAACVAGEAEGAPDRVTIGGESGCAAPIARAGADGRWAASLTETLSRVGLSPLDAPHVSPEPRVPFGRFVEATRAVQAAGLRFPYVPEGMVQGNDGPPLCDAAVRDAESLGLANARWYGANRGRD